MTSSALLTRCRLLGIPYFRLGNHGACQGWLRPALLLKGNTKRTRSLPAKGNNEFRWPLTATVRSQPPAATRVTASDRTCANKNDARFQFPSLVKVCLSDSCSSVLKQCSRGVHLLFAVPGIGPKGFILLRGTCQAAACM